MTSIPESSAKLNWRVGAGLLLAAIASIGTLLWAGDPDRRAFGLPVSPFGWHRVAVIHALAALPLSWWAASMLQRWPLAWRARRMTLVWLGLGLTVCGLTLVAGRVVEQLLPQAQVGAVARFLCRVAWCVVLQTPWCLAGLAAGAAEAPPCPAASPSAGFSPANLLALALVIAIGVPMSFFAVFMGQQTEQARAAWSEERFVDARGLVQRLCDLGSTTNLGERTEPGQPPLPVTPTRALADLRQAERFVEGQIERLSHASPSLPQRLQLAQCLRALNRVAEAESVLRPVADHQPVAALTLAELHRSRNDLRSGSKWAARALQMAQDMRPAGQQEVDTIEELQLRAYDILILAAGEAADFETAERFLWEAWERLPKRRAQIYYRLGKHYEFVGELSRAIECQRQAASLASDQYAPPPGLLAKMLSTGAPVGLARPKSSRYQ